MTVPYHMPLAPRKALAAKAILLEAVHRHSSNPEISSDLLDRAESDLGIITARATNPTTGSPNNIQLDHFVADVFNRLRRSKAPFDVTARERRQFLAVMQDCRNSASRIQCSNCTSPELVCRGSTRDDVAVSERGTCIAAIKRMFDVALRTSKEYYLAHSPLYASLDAASIPEVVLSTRYSVATPHELPVPLFVSGATA